MCAYRAELAPEALFDVASVHPLTRAPERMPLFQVFFSHDRTMLTGSVDTSGAHRLARVLDASPVTGPVAVLDVRLLEFVDVAGARVLACWARDLAARGLALHLTGASRLLRHMWQILALDRIAPVTFAEPRP
jgi:ABC-type transporter Mla MlaB component